MWAPTFYFLISFLFSPVPKPRSKSYRGVGLSASLTSPALERDGYGLAILSAVYFFNLGMCCDCFKETVMYHIKGSNCKVNYYARFQASQCNRTQATSVVLCDALSGQQFPNPHLPRHHFMVQDLGRGTGGDGAWELRLETWNYNLKWTFSLTCSFL